MTRRWLMPLALLLLSSGVVQAPAATAPRGVPAATSPREVIVDTDIGDDYDDAVALALVLASPHLKLDAVITSFGDTALRARMVQRLLREIGRTDVAVVAGPATPPGTRFTQSAWAAGGPPPAAAPGALGTILARLRAEPAGRITLIELAPETTLGAMLARDPVAVRRLAGVVLMGGSVRRGYGPTPGTNSDSPSIEYNVRRDPAGLRALLGSGVPVWMMPLDATEVPLDDAARQRLFATGTPLARWLATLYPAWADSTGGSREPTLFDVVPVAWLLRPDVCRPVPLDIVVSPAGDTTVGGGPPDAGVCLDIDRGAVLSLLQDRLAAR